MDADVSDSHMFIRDALNRFSGQMDELSKDVRASRDISVENRGKLDSLVLSVREMRTEIEEHHKRLSLLEKRSTRNHYIRQGMNYLLSAVGGAVLIVLAFLTDVLELWKQLAGGR